MDVKEGVHAFYVGAGAALAADVSAASSGSGFDPSYKPRTTSSVIPTATTRKRTSHIFQLARMRASSDVERVSSCFGRHPSSFGTGWPYSAVMPSIVSGAASRSLSSSSSSCFTPYRDSMLLPPRDAGGGCNACVQRGSFDGAGRQGDSRERGASQAWLLTLLAKQSA